MKTCTTLSLALVVCAGLIATACGSDGGGDDPLPTTCDNPEFEATFVVDSLTIPDQDVGFNLDDEDTYCDSGCIVDGENGVDNRLGEVVAGIADAIGEDFDANAELEDQILGGDMLILFRVMNICNFTADGDVDLYGYIGLDTDDPADPADNFSGHEPLDVDSRSLEDPGTSLDAPLISFMDAEIDRGQFSAGPSVFRLDIPISDSELHLEIRETQVQFNFSPNPEDDGSGNYVDGGMVNGLLGGYVLVEDLSDALEEFASELGEIDPETIQAIAANQADIDHTPAGPTTESCTTSEDCVLDWRVCEGGFCVEPDGKADAISLAIQFTGRSCVMTGDIVTP